ncbi:MAG TPA: ATP-binding protein [Candidatus Paceibacterota bacterium]|jgi:predicted kinase
MSIVIVGIGVPGSGKTTFLKRLAEERRLTYINKDDIRAELLGDVNDQSRNRDVWIESERRTNEALKANRDVVLDATYAERWKRVELIESLRAHGAHKVFAAYFDIPFEQASAQNEGREYVVGERDMAWFREQLEKEPPSEEEGFDAVYGFASLNDLEEALG